MDIDKAQYDGSATAELCGLSGLFKNSRLTLRLGQCIVVGRSRVCDLSVARAESCMRMGRAELEAHPSYRKISRQHLRICLTGEDRIEVEDLSTNGTVVNGFRVDRLVIDRFQSENRRLLIELGQGEMLEVVPGNSDRERSSEALTERRSLPVVEPQPEEHLSGVDHTPMP